MPRRGRMGEIEPWKPDKIMFQVSDEMRERIELAVELGHAVTNSEIIRQALDEHLPSLEQLRAAKKLKAQYIGDGNRYVRPVKKRGKKA